MTHDVRPPYTYATLIRQVRKSRENYVLICYVFQGYYRISG